MREIHMCSIDTNGVLIESFSISQTYWINYDGEIKIKLSSDDIDGRYFLHKWATENSEKFFKIDFSNFVDRCIVCLESHIYEKDINNYIIQYKKLEVATEDTYVDSVRNYVRNGFRNLLNNVISEMF